MAPEIVTLPSDDDKPTLVTVPPPGTPLPIVVYVISPEVGLYLRAHVPEDGLIGLINNAFVLVPVEFKLVPVALIIMVLSGWFDLPALSPIATEY